MNDMPPVGKENASYEYLMTHAHKGRAACVMPVYCYHDGRDHKGVYRLSFTASRELREDEVNDFAVQMSVQTHRRAYAQGLKFRDHKDN